MPGSEIVWGADHAPLAVRDADWIRKLVPSERVHTATTVPSGAEATSGSKPSCPAAERFTAVRNVGVACAAAGSIISAATRNNMKSCHRCIAQSNMAKLTPPAKIRAPLHEQRDPNTE